MVYRQILPTETANTRAPAKGAKQPKFRLRLLLLIVALATIAGCSRSSAGKQQTLKLLDEFKTSVSDEMKIRDVTPVDPKLLAELETLSKAIPDSQLPVVEEYALSDENGVVRSFMLRILIERGEYDSAARVVARTSSTPDNVSLREAAIRWWEYSFYDKENYKEMSERFVDALLRQFRDGDQKTKATVAEIFGLDPSLANQDFDHFKAAVRKRGPGIGK